MQWLPACRVAILIFITCPLTRSAKPDVARQSSGFLNHQAIVCHIPFEKFPYFPVKFMKAAVCLFFCSSPLWSHSPLVDCLPNGHWQMMLKIAGLAPLLQTAIEVGQCCRFLMPYSVWSELFNIMLSYLYTSPISVSVLCLSFCLSRSWWMFSHASHKGFRLHKGCAAGCSKSNDFLWCALTYCTIDDLHLIKTKTMLIAATA